MKRILFFFAAVLLGMPSFVLAQTSDTLPPTLVTDQPSGFSPAAINVTGGPASVTVDLYLTDDLSGVTFSSSINFPGPGLTFRSPSGAQSQRVASFVLVDESAIAEHWQATINFPQGSESGQWTVESLILEDLVGNTATLDGPTLAGMGFPTLLEVTSIGDLTAPTLVNLTIDPLTVDTSNGGATVTVTMELTDEDSGVDFSPRPDLSFYFALGIQNPTVNFIRICSEPVLVTGDSLAGTWSSTCYVPRYSQAGTWSFYGPTLRDVAGNIVTVQPADLQQLGLPTGFEVTSTPSDTTPIQLSSFSFSPNFIDTSVGPATVSATVIASDDLSGVSAVQVNFRSPSGGQRRTLYTFDNTSGTPLNGTFEGSVEFPQYSEAGTWQVEYLFHYDNVFNNGTLQTADMRALGFPTVLNVVLPSLIGDGIVSSDGGTVTDEVFGERAQITLPAGAVSVPTDVAIDVLESPLTFPMPAGFAAPGTRFVNVSFTPPAAMPFPSPGATVVLPLVDPMLAGTVLALYRVDPGTGTLVPAISVLGGQVFGAVDQGGLSATFTGVSQFSVLVGLIPDNKPPVVTPPASITVAATEAGGARGSASAALASFLAAGTATDDTDPAPVRLAPQVGGTDVTNATLFGLGTTVVTFRFQDAAGNIGTATANVTVVAGRPRIAGKVVAKGTLGPGTRTVDVQLTNTGNGIAMGVKLNQILLRTLSGSGTVTLASPAVPVTVGDLDVGASATVSLGLNVPATVTRFSITENGTLKDVSGASFSFSMSQSVIP